MNFKNLFCCLLVVLFVALLCILDLSPAPCAGKAIQWVRVCVCACGNWETRTALELRIG